MDYVLVIHPAEEGGYWAEVPALPGCFSQGETIDELLKDAPLAIESHLASMRQDGQEVPTESLLIATVRMPEPSAA